MRLVASLFMCLLAQNLAIAEAGAQQPAIEATKPQVEFTRLQDLNPNQVSGNRPIRQKWAVVVGISKYQDRRLSNDIRNDKAARDFYAYLTDDQAGRFPADHVKLLTNESATFHNIQSAFGPRWLGTLAGKDDLVVVFIATNGFPTTDGGAYLSSYDCALDNIYGTCLSMKDLMQSLTKSVSSDRVVLVLQSCYSGSADLASGAKSISSKRRSLNLDPSQLMLGKGYVILSSSRPDQLTWGDVFSQSLINALKQQNGLIPLKLAFEKAKEQTEYETTYKMFPAKTQTPTMQSAWTGTDLILGAPPLEKVANLSTDVSNYLGAEAHYLKASKLMVDGDIDRALPEYKLAIAADPTYADAIADYGVSLGLKNEWKNAVTQLSRAVELSPNDVLYRTNLARALDQTGDQGECIKQLEMAYAINPKDSAVLKGLASKAVAAGDIATARKLLSEATELYPDSAPLHDRLSYVFSLSGDLEDALFQANKAIELDPTLLSARINQGSILYSRGNFDQAIASYRNVLGRDPANKDAWYLLSQACEKKGDLGQTREALQHFISICPPADKRLDIARKRLADLTPSN